MPTPKPSVADEILKDLADGTYRMRCTVRSALEKLDPAAREAFEIALASSSDVYGHAVIARRLTDLTGVPIGREAVPKHRRALAGQRGCGCGKH